MWVLAEYEAVTLFSLRYSSATSSGGKTLLVPTPYAFKMALLDVACRTLGMKDAEMRWETIRDLRISVDPPAWVTVSNLFQKVLRPRRNPAAEGDADSGPFQRTIGYREYAHWSGPMRVACGWDGPEHREWLESLMANISYLGKRGGFMQVTRFPDHRETLPDHYIDFTREQEAFPIRGILQPLDDCDASLTFEKANVFSHEKVRSGKERITRSIVLPYRLARSSKAFSLYERTH